MGDTPPESGRKPCSRSPKIGHFGLWRPIAAYGGAIASSAGGILRIPAPPPRGRRGKIPGPGRRPAGSSPRLPPGAPGKARFPRIRSGLSAIAPSLGVIRSPLRLRSPSETRYRSTRPSGGARRSMTRGALRSERRSYAPCSLSMLACCCPRAIAASAGYHIAVNDASALRSSTHLS